jgi:hypothetical protein
MISLKAIAGGIAVAGALTLAPLGLGVANADPSPYVPQVTSTADGTQANSQTPSWPSPFAPYGGSGICADPGMYFVNICA